MSPATTAARATAARPATVAAVVPAADEGASSCWRRLVTAVDPGAEGAFALTGVFLEPGAAYELPAGALVVACDRRDDGTRTVRLLRAGDGGLDQIKAWELKAKLGRRVVDYTARRLAPGAHRHTATALEALPNRWDGHCAHCRGPVPAHTGIVARIDGRDRVTHHRGTCPPPPPRRNFYPGECARCGGWVEADAGARRSGTDPLPGAPRHRVVHDGACPERPQPAPVKTTWYDGWCRDW